MFRLNSLAVKFFVCFYQGFFCCYSSDLYLLIGHLTKSAPNFGFSFNSNEYELNGVCFE